jgi:hypothetical protein
MIRTTSTLSIFSKSCQSISAYQLTKSISNLSTNRHNVCIINLSPNKREKANYQMRSSFVLNKQEVSFSLFETNPNKEWLSILTKAEKVVGYPTSFLNLRYLVSDEVAHFANLLRKLMQTKHPLIKLARGLVLNNDAESKRNVQINGLLILLISKAAGIPRKQANILDSEVSDGIHNSQRCLAEIAEMIYMGSLIHKGVLNIKEVSIAEKKEMDQGNKIAVLCGDYLLASACTNLSKLNNTEVKSWILLIYFSSFFAKIFRK